MIWPPASAGDAHAAAAAISAQQLNENRGIAPSRLPKLPFVQYFLACHIILVSCPSRRSIYLTPLDPREPAPPAPPSPRRHPVRHRRARRRSAAVPGLLFARHLFD